MRPKRGFRLKMCVACKRNRHCTSHVTDDWFRRWTCSQGHIWRVKMLTKERSSECLRRVYGPLLSELINARNPLLEFFCG